MEEREIRGVWDDRCIRVYQAYSPVIAEEAVRLGEEITALLPQERVYLPR